MSINQVRLRHYEKGGALAASLFFMIVVTIAGIALMGSSTRNQMSIIERSVDVRLMIAVEAGVESVRGRFKLVENVQEDWSWMGSNDMTNPYDMGYLSINGIQVHLQCWPIGDPSVPICTVRASASAAGITRFVEMDLKVAAFSDYAMFMNAKRPGLSNWGAINIHGRFHTNTSCQFLSPATKFWMAPSVGIGSGGSWANMIEGNWGGSYDNSAATPSSTTRISQGWNEVANVDVVIPEGLVHYNSLQNKALDTQPSSTKDYTFYENTLELQFRGTQVRRIFVKKTGIDNLQLPPSWAGGTTNLFGSAPNRDTDLQSMSDYTVGAPLDHNAGWCNTTVGDGNLNIYGSYQNWYSTVTSGVAHSSVSGNSYVLSSEIIELPDNGVIYVKIGSPSMWGSADDAQVSSAKNRYTQAHIRHPELSQNIPGTTASSLSVYTDDTRTPILLLSGIIDSRRVSVVADGINAIVKDNIIYKHLADTPGLRQGSPKTDQTQIDNNMGKEILGLISRQRNLNASDTNTDNTDKYTTGDPRFGGGDVSYAHQYFESITGTVSRGSWTINTPAYTGSVAVSGHHFADGVHMGTYSVGNNYSTNKQNVEFWTCGGMISHFTTSYCENSWDLVHYDWDYRLAKTTPPYFLSAYGVSARFVPGSWRSWRQ